LFVLFYLFLKKLSDGFENISIVFCDDFSGFITYKSFW
jgi:hypothetical protein